MPIITSLFYHFAKMQFTTLFLSLVAIVSAAPTELVSRDATTCGTVYYSASQVDSASQAACRYVQNGGTAGGSTYPHKYNNYEGFNFPVNGPYYEFPIKSGGVYTGGLSSFPPSSDGADDVSSSDSNTYTGSPGADRVVINSQCDEAGVITHRGASGNNFVGCEGTS